jgi:hypothetical protein
MNNYIIDQDIYILSGQRIYSLVINTYSIAYVLITYYTNNKYYYYEEVLQIH